MATTLEYSTPPPGLHPQGGVHRRQIVDYLLLVGKRVAECLPKDGTEGLTAYTLTPDTRPDATLAPGAIIYVSDAAPGAKFQGSGGTATWVNLG